MGGQVGEAKGGPWGKGVLLLPVIPQECDKQDPGGPMAPAVGSPFKQLPK